MGQLFLCYLLLALLATVELKDGHKTYVLQVKEETTSADLTRKELANGNLSPQTIKRLAVAINSMKRSGDERLIEAARQLEDGHINFNELQDYVADKVAKGVTGAYSTVLYFLDRAQNVHPVKYTRRKL